VTDLPDGKPARTLSWLTERFRCPDCHAPGLQQIDAALVCTRCTTAFPLAQGRPVLIRTDNDLFPRSSYLKATLGSTTSQPGILARVAPSRSVNLSYRRNLRAFAAALSREGGTSVLVIGAGSQKRWLDKFFLDYPGIRVVYSEIPGPQSTYSATLMTSHSRMRVSAVSLPPRYWNTLPVRTALRPKCIAYC